MSAVKEFFDSISESAKERVKNPFFGAFFISWTIVNWKLLLTIVMTKKDIEVVIAEFDKSGLFDNYYNLFLYPLLFSAVYIFVGPYFSYAVHYFRKKGLLLIKKTKFEFETDILDAKSILIQKEADNETRKEVMKNTSEYNRKKNELDLKEKELELEERRKNLNDERIKARYEEKQEKLDVERAELNTERERFNDEVIKNNDIKSLIKDKEDMIQAFEFEESKVSLKIQELTKENQALTVALTEAIKLFNKEESDNNGVVSVKPMDYYKNLLISLKHSFENVLNENKMNIDDKH